VGLIVRELEVSLAAHHETVAMDEHAEPRVSQAIEWLKASCAAEGYWGHRSVAVTALAVVAIGSWRPGEAHRLLADASSWLCTQATDGAWETPWDSAVALQAIIVAGRERDPVARRALERINTLRPADEWGGRLHHAAQVLAGLALSGASSEVLEEWSDMLARRISLADGPYVCGQVVHALLVSGRRAPDDLGPAIAMLCTYLEQTPLSTSAFLDCAAALRALAVTGRHDDAVGMTLDKMFGACFRRDGSWYHEPWYTSWGLLALREAGGIRRVIIEAPAFRSAIRAAEAQVAELAAEWRGAERDAARERRASALLGALVGGNVAALVALSVIWADSDSLLVGGVGVTVLVSTLTALLTELRQRTARAVTR
jgi:hypothetical protein